MYLASDSTGREVALKLVHEDSRPTRDFGPASLGRCGQVSGWEACVRPTISTPMWNQHGPTWSPSTCLAEIWPTTWLRTVR